MPRESVALVVDKASVGQGIFPVVSALRTLAGGSAVNVQIASSDSVPAIAHVDDIALPGILNGSQMRMPALPLQ